jgi:uridylate kinase
MEAKYRRVLIKMSGEALAGSMAKGIDFAFLDKLCKAVKECRDLGVQVAIVCGGGNYWRGAKDGGDRMVRARADYMGMLATAMNSVALVDALEKAGVEAVIQASFGLERIAEPFNRDAAVRHLKAGRAVIFACGSGEPYFTTDTAAVLRALDVEADVLLLGKNVDGLYSADPRLDPAAEKFDRIAYAEVLRRDLKAMDAAATQLAMENRPPLHVFGLEDPENIIRAAAGEAIGTIVY